MGTSKIIEKIKEIKNLCNGSCLCGHNEWCEICSPSSNTNKVIKIIQEIEAILETDDCH